MKSKHLIFEEIGISSRKTKVFRVISKHDNYCLARIYWHRCWRQYVLEPEQLSVIWSHDCLSDASQFIKELMEERKKKVAR